MIRFIGVSKWFGSLQVLREVDLEVAAGEVLVVCGPSGSGKSTLIRCINKLEPIQQGDIVVDGMSLSDPATDITKLRAEVGMVFQQFNLYPHMTVQQNITLAPVKVRKQSRDEAEHGSPGTSWPRSGSRRKRSNTPRNCPAASSSGWRSPGPWPCNPRSCSSTSRPRPSIPR